jgi:hypothetical protein
MSDTLELNCWVLDDPVENVFPVEILNTKTVGALKEVIKDKKKPVLDGFPADALLLWMVCCHLLAGIPTLTSSR